jgi:hypothetical protein
VTNTNELVWKARFIVTQDGHVDLPPDRQEVIGPEDKDLRQQFLDDLNEKLPGRELFDTIAKKLITHEINTRETKDIVLLNEKGFFVKGNANRSAGYFYVEARRAQNDRPDLEGGGSYPPLDTYEQFMATYDPDGTRTTVIKIPRRVDDSPTEFIVLEDPNGRRVLLNPMPFDEYFDVDVHAFHAAGNPAPIGVMAMADGSRSRLEQPEHFPKLTGNNWPAGRLLALFVD